MCCTKRAGAFHMKNAENRRRHSMEKASSDTHLASGFYHNSNELPPPSFLWFCQSKRSTREERSGGVLLGAFICTCLSETFERPRGCMGVYNSFFVPRTNKPDSNWVQAVTTMIAGKDERLFSPVRSNSWELQTVSGPNNYQRAAG